LGVQINHPATLFLSKFFSLLEATTKNYLEKTKYVIVGATGSIAAAVLLILFIIPSTFSRTDFKNDPGNQTILSPFFRSFGSYFLYCLLGHDSNVQSRFV
jgi:hypothetical protein